MAINRGKNLNKHQGLERLRRRLRLIYLQILRIDDPPERIARGAAIGVMMGILPTFGLGIILSIIFAFIFRANKAAAVLGSLIMNPVTSTFFWTLSALVGSVVFWEDSRLILENLKNGSFLDGVGWATVVYLVGNAIVTAVFTTATYYLVKKEVERHRIKKAKRLERKRLLKER